jgi:hypothetical protein
MSDLNDSDPRSDSSWIARLVATPAFCETQQLMAHAVNYYPYCNRVFAEPLTDEHVIPQALGGDRRT